MSEHTDYKAVAVPDEKPPTEYSYVERRAEILSLIEQAGHPDALNMAQLARRYETSRSNVYKDFQRLKDFYRDRIGDDARVKSDWAYNKIIQEHMDNREFDKARKALDSWNGWLQDTGEQEKEPDKHEVTGEDGGPLEINMSETVVETDYDNE